MPNCASNAPVQNIQVHWSTLAARALSVSVIALAIGASVANAHSGPARGAQTPSPAQPSATEIATPPGMMNPAEVSRALAGQGPGSLTSLWNSSPALSASQMARIQNFASANMPESYQGSQNVLYPFGGPDVIYPQMFFPNMNRLTLIGVEPVGTFPQARSAAELAGLGREVGSAHQTVAMLSYHRTLAMREQVTSLGVTPLLLAGLAVTGNEVLGVTIETIDRGGVRFAGNNIVYTGQPNAVTIRYRRAGGGDGEVVYFNADLSDASLGVNAEFTRRMRNRGIDTAYYKAASYLSHGPSFGNINQLVASQARWVVQSDTGLPARYVLDDPSWTRVRLFGVYTQPIPTFGGHPQQMDLLEAQAGAACSSGGVAAAFSRHWRTDVCSRYGRSTRYQKVSYGGLVPFDVDYQRDKRDRDAIFLMYASR